MQPGSSEPVSWALEGDCRSPEGRSEESSDASAEGVTGEPDLRVGKHNGNVVVEVGTAGERIRKVVSERREEIAGGRELTLGGSRPTPR